MVGSGRIGGGQAMDVGGDLGVPLAVQHDNPDLTRRSDSNVEKTAELTVGTNAGPPGSRSQRRSRLSSPQA